MIKITLSFLLGITLGILVIKLFTKDVRYRERLERETLLWQKDSLQRALNYRSLQIKLLIIKTDSLLDQREKQHIEKMDAIKVKQNEEIHYVNTVDSAYIGILSEGLRDSD